MDGSGGSERLARWAWWLLPLLAVCAVMLPRLSVPTIGMVDDGVMLHQVREMAEDWRVSYLFQQSDGRFFPVFLWGLYAVSALGLTPAVFLGANLAVCAATTLALAWIVKARGGTPLQAGLAGVFFATSAPAVTTFYTITKQEAPAVLWIAASLVCAVRASRARSGGVRAGLAAAAGLALLASYSTKETAVAMIPISVGWLAVGAWSRVRGSARAPIGGRAAYAVASVLAGAAWVGLRRAAAGGAAPAGPYAQLYAFKWEAVARTFTDWTVILVRDWAHVAPAVVVLALSWAVVSRAERILLGDALVWMIGWEAVHLPWAWTITYYAYPFAFGCAALAGVSWGAAWGTARTDARAWRRRLAALAIAAGAVLWAMVLVSTATDARVQLAFDDANWRMLAFLKAAPADEPLWLNVPNGEFGAEIWAHVHDAGRPVTLRVVDAKTWGDRAAGERAPRGLVLMPQYRNQTLHSVRVPVEEGGVARQNAWLRARMPADSAQVFAVERRVPLLTFRLHKPICALFVSIGSPGFYCRPADPFVDTRVLSYGWTVYRVT